MDVEKLVALRDSLIMIRSRWDWELEQSESDRLAGKDERFLRARAGYVNTQEAINTVDYLIGVATDWYGLFPDQPPPEVQHGK